MRKLKKILKLIYNSNYRFLVLSCHGFYKNMSDKEFVKKKYKIIFGKDLDLNNPKIFNEKLQWLKLYDRRLEYTMMADKYLVKDYVSSIIGKEYIIPTIGVWNSPDDIDFDRLPNKFVLKCNHNSGTGMCICTDKLNLNIKKVKRELKKGLKEDFYLNGREWPYKNIERKIIAEKYLEDNGKIVPEDYKIHCFNGEPKFIQVDYDRFINHRRNLYTVDWKYIEAEIEYKTDKNHIIERPEALEEMVYLAKKLAKDIPYVRTDFYYVNGKIYFGELTFFHGSGFEVFKPISLEKKLGDWLNLPNNKDEE